MGEPAQLTRELVQIPSHEDETEVGDAIESWLRKKTDADVSRDDVGNILARKGSGDETIALVGHHDVVAPDDSQITAEGDYVVEDRDGRLYGRGTADMKGSVAAMMCAFRDAGPNCELVFASFVGEEVGGVGARHAINEGFDPDYAIVGEGSTNYSDQNVTDVVFAHRGRQEHHITIRGTAAHASEPMAGENAVYRATSLITEIRNLEFPSVTLRDEPFTGSAAVTGIRDGGNAANIIPDECVVTVDERTVPEAGSALSGVKERPYIEFAADENFPPMRCADDDFAELVQSAADAVQDGTPKLMTKPHATDAGWLSQAGVTCVVCGASEPGEAHTEHESVSIDVLDRCYRIYRETVEQV